MIAGLAAVHAALGVRPTIIKKVCIKFGRRYKAELSSIFLRKLISCIGNADMKALVVFGE